MSRVNKSDAFDIYRVRAGYNDQEWATIAICGWIREGFDGHSYEVGEIMIHSSFGSWAYQWGNLGQPFKTWIANIKDEEYVAEKLLGTKAYVFDGAKTVKELRKDLIKCRRRDDLSKSEARGIWDWIDDDMGRMEASDRDFVESMRDAETEVVPTKQAMWFLSEPWERLMNKLNPSFQHFWQQIMPEFQQALRDEIAAESNADRVNA